MNLQLSPATLNATICNGLAIFAGADWSLPVQVCERKVEAGKIKDTPVDLTGLTGRASIKAYAGADQAIAIPTVEITDALDGRILISLTAEETAAIVVKGYTWKDISVFQWDCYLDDALTEETYRILQGSIEVSPKVTDGDDHE